MEPHRIPQQVLGYQGRIVGRFTAKQFIVLAIGGIIIFILFTSLPLGASLFFLAGIVAGLSALFALSDIEGQTLDIWLLNFLKVAGGPTLMVWKKEGVIPSFLLPSYRPKPKPSLERKPQTREEVESLIEFLRKEEKPSDLTPAEEEFLQRLDFSTPLPMGLVQRAFPNLPPGLSPSLPQTPPKSEIEENNDLNQTKDSS